MFEDKDEKYGAGTEGYSNTEEQDTGVSVNRNEAAAGNAEEQAAQGTDWQSGRNVNAQASQSGNEQAAQNTGWQTGQSSNAQQGDSTYRMTFDRQGGQQQNQQSYQQTQQQRYSYTPQGSQTGGRRRDRGSRSGIRRPYLKAVGTSVICGLIIAVCVVSSFAIGRNIAPTNTTSVTINTNDASLASESTVSTASDAAIEAENVAATGEYTVAQIAEHCGSSVVAITNRSVQEVLTMFGYYEQESEGSGSGVIVGLNDEELLIVTNYHVVEDADDLTVCFFDSEDAVYSALVKGTDPNNDLAVVAIPVSDLDTDLLSQITIATIGDSDSMKVGDGVVAIGNALGLGQSVTSGIISAVDREVYIDNYTARLIQTDAAINPGNSGGALFNMKGELIGINSAKYASEEIEGMGFAIPTSIAQPIIETLMSQQTRTKLDENYGALSISGTDVTTDAYYSYGMPQGVYVASVVEGGAADNAGIQTGDIITALDGISVSGIENLRERLQYYAAGEDVEVTIARNSGNGYEETNIVVQLDNVKSLETEESSSEESESQDYGDYYGYGDGDYYGYGDGDYYGYGDGDYYGYGDIYDFFNGYGDGSNYGYSYGF